MTRRVLPPVSLAVLLFSAACAPSGRQEAPPTATPPTESRAIPTINHLTPARDSSGSAPARFEWTPVTGTERYAIGIWNDVDMLMWRRDDLLVPTVTLPSELKLEFGTYFWSVTALRADTPIGESGRAAFVVLR
jgi:hypothetical protein